MTLTGDVDTATARDRAVMLARDTDGVTDVIDNLELTDTAATTGVDRDTDVDITEGAREIGEAAKEGAREVGEGAERIGEGARDVVTGDDK